jgi:tetratricopeptide (TPR) repeat protein
VGKCYAELRYYDEAVNYLNQAIQRSNSKLPDDAEEKLCLMKYKKYFYEMNTKGKSGEAMDKTLKKMKEILAVNASAERFNLLGSTLKTMACFETSAVKRNALMRDSEFYYREGYKRILSDSGNIIYPLSNVLAMQFIRTFGKGKNDPAPYLKQLEADYAMCQNQLDLSDFWDLMAKANMLFVKTLLTVRTKMFEANLTELKEAIRFAWKEGGTISKKLSELEHLDILIGLLKHYPKNAAKLEIKFMEELKTFITQLQNSDKHHVFD